MSEKRPWFAFYPGDWKRDTQHLPPHVKAAWIDILCHLWWQDGKQDTLTIDEWARVIGVTPGDAEATVGDALSTYGLCGFRRESDGCITLWSRRWQRVAEQRAKAQARDRKYKQRRRRDAKQTGEDVIGLKSGVLSKSNNPPQDLTSVEPPPATPEEVEDEPLLEVMTQAKLRQRWRIKPLPYTDPHLSMQERLDKHNVPPEQRAAVTLYYQYGPQVMGWTLTKCMERVRKHIDVKDLDGGPTLDGDKLNAGITLREVIEGLTG